MKTNKPHQETISAFNDIKQFINSNKTKEEKRLSLAARDTVKMPYKMFKGIKASVIKKHNINKQNNMLNNILGETLQGEKKLMTGLVEKKMYNDIEKKKNQKLCFSYAKSKAKYQNGVLNISKRMMNDIKGGDSNNLQSKRRPFKKGFTGKKTK